MGIKDLIKMNDEQPTPITDAATHSDWCGALAVEVETSQMLERDLYKAREQISVMREAIKEAHKTLERLADCDLDFYEVRLAESAIAKLQPFLKP